MPLTPGTRLGSYEIVSLLGAGGMGEVYKAKDLKLGRDVAIKVLREELASDPERLRRFEQEAQAFFYDSDPLDFEWREEQQYLEMRDGQLEAVMVKGYWNEPVASYYRQKCQFGLYQALHRIRPYNPSPTTATSSSSPTCRFRRSSWMGL